MKSITLHFTEALIRKAVLAFWLRAVGWQGFIALGLLLIYLIVQLARGDRSWVVGATGTVIALAALMAGALYFVHFRAALGRFRRMRSPEGKLEMGVETYRLSSDVGTSEFAWKTITEVWCYPEFWLVFLAPAQFITFPLTDFDAESREFFLEKIRSHGGRIK